MNTRKAYGKFCRTFFFASVVFLCGCSLLVPNVEQDVRQLKSGQYQLDPTHTAVIFKLSHMGLSTFVGRFNSFEASLDFNPENMLQTSLDARVDTLSVDTGNDILDEQLRSSTWLNSEAHTHAYFVSQSVNPIEGNRYQLVGELTLNGVTKPLILEAEFHGGATNLLTGFYTLGFSAQASFQRSDFDIDAYPGLVGETIDLEVYAEFQRKGRSLSAQ